MPSFDTISESEKYKNDTPEQQKHIRDLYFQKYVAPKVDEKGGDPAHIRNLFERKYAGEQMPPEPSSMSAQDVMGGAISNLGPSARQYGEDIYTAVSDPINTAKSIYELGKGAVQLVIPGEQGNEELARGVGKFFAERYGTVESIKKTIANDPVAVLGDLSMMLSGGGTLAARIPGLTKASKFASKALPGKFEITPESIAKFGSNIDPLSMAGKSIAGAAQGIGNLSADVVGGVLSGSGSTPLKTAFREGLEGGDTVAKSMRGTAVEAEEVVRKAHDQMKKMAKERLEHYRANKEQWSGLTNKIDFDGVRKHWRELMKTTQDRGVSLVRNSTDRAKLKRMYRVLEDWAKRPNMHDALGFDSLKKALDSIDINPAKHKHANRLRTSMNKHIRDQIKLNVPEYAKAMDDYAEAIALERQLEKTLSLGGDVPVDTTLRKLQSAMRDNVNAGLGHREKLLKELDKSGEIFDTLAGQALNPKTPRGIARMGAGFAGLGVQGSTGFNPMLAGVMGAQSPRLTGEAARLAGRVGYIPRKIYKGGEALGRKLGFEGGLPYRQAGRGLFQAGRIKDLEDEYIEMQMSKKYKKAKK